MQQPTNHNSMTPRWVKVTDSHHPIVEGAGGHYKAGAFDAVTNDCPVGDVLASDNGFSLLEMLVALAVLSIALLPLVSQQANSIKNASIIEERFLAQMVAENVAVTLLSEAEVRLPGTIRGNSIQANVPFQWRVSVTQRLDQNMMLYQIQVMADKVGRAQKGILASHLVHKKVDQ